MEHNFSTPLYQVLLEGIQLDVVCARTHSRAKKKRERPRFCLLPLPLLVPFLTRTRTSFDDVDIIRGLMRAVTLEVAHNARGPINHCDSFARHVCDAFDYDPTGRGARPDIFLAYPKGVR